MSCSASGTYSLPSAFMKSYCVSTSQKMTRGDATAIQCTPQEGLATGNLSGRRGVCQPSSTLQRERDGHLVAGMLARAARAVGPDFERELLFFHDPKAKSHEEQGFARQPKNLIQAERACVHQQRFHECLADAASLLVVSHGESRDFRERSTVDFEAARADQTAIGRFSRSEEHTSELQSHHDLVCRLLL